MHKTFIISEAIVISQLFNLLISRRCFLLCFGVLLRRFLLITFLQQKKKYWLWL